MKTKLTSLITVFLFAVNAIIITSCRKQEIQKYIPPDLPPMESMSIPMKGFTTNSGVNNKKSYLWFGVSTLYIRNWSEQIGSTLTLPSVSFKEAFNHKRIQIEENLWRWSYNIILSEKEYNLELEASFDGDKIIWEMFFSKKGKGSFSRFKWFTGISDRLGTVGSWAIYKYSTEINVLYVINWQKNHKDGLSEITFTNFYKSKFNKNSYINYKKTNGTPYDATYTIYDGNKDKIIRIQWNSILNEGSIKLTQNKIINGPHYWDLNKSDLIACPY